MPVDVDQPAPEPASPTERALADLWPRTAAPMSREWRLRMRGEIENLLVGHVQELRSAIAGHTADPVEYLEMKRKTNGARVAACLAEFARGAELPPVIAAGPTVRALVDAVTDSCLLINDIFSYERESADAAETGNMVVILQKFLGCDAQRAVEATNDMLTARLRQFEHTADVEIPEMCAAHHLDPEQRTTVLDLVDSLRDWPPGWLEWHKTSARYQSAATTATPVIRRTFAPTGLGTATTRRLTATLVEV
jgi:germacradienol/geosmin synthase